MKNLKTKLTTAFLALTLIPLIITVVIIVAATGKGFTDLTDTQQRDMIHTVQTEIDVVADELLSLTMIYANHEALIANLQSGDHAKLEQTVKGIFPRLQEEHRISAFEFGDTNGIVLLRGHNPSEYGDDKSSMPSIQAALNGQAISGFEFGKSGLSVRAFSPITANNKVIGTLQTSIDGSFMQKINESIQGVTISLYDTKGELMMSSDEGTSQQTVDSDVIEQLEKIESVTFTSDTYLQSLLPMFDPTGNVIIGVISITQDISAIQGTEQRIVLIALVICMLALAAVIVVAMLISRSIANPIVKAADAMHELAAGNLTVDVPSSKSKDEIGQLTSAMQTMKHSLHDIIKKVMDASLHVASKSSELQKTSTEIQYGSDQIASTMQELSTGSESHAQNITSIAATMNEFTETIQETSNSGQQINTDAQHVLTLTDQGKKAMDASNEQMSKIDDIMQEAVSKMDHLDQQSKQISSIVTIIQDIAAQTNLLALNAAIEAARAGEHGRGFAVVADEVRKLAEQVSVSVNDITSISTNIQHETAIVEASLQAGYEEIKLGTTQIQSTSDTFNEITESVTRVAATITQISAYLSNNVQRAQHMNHTVEDIAAISEETAAAIVQTSATTQQFNSSIDEVSSNTKQLANLAEELKQLVKQFKV